MTKPTNNFDPEKIGNSPVEAIAIARKDTIRSSAFTILGAVDAMVMGHSENIRDIAKKWALRSDPLRDMSIVDSSHTDADLASLGINNNGLLRLKEAIDQSSNQDYIEAISASDKLEDTNETTISKNQELEFIIEARLKVQDALAVNPNEDQASSFYATNDQFTVA